MTFLSFLARTLLLRQIFGLGRSHGRRPHRHGWGAPPRRHHHARGRFGFFGPMPTYSRRTRRGTTVGVSGCCLPIPIGFGLLAAGLVRVLAARR